MDKKEMILEAMRNTLLVQEIGPDDDFFEAGGNSMLAMMLLLELKDLGISARDIYECRTARKLAQAAENRLKGENGAKEKKSARNTSWTLTPYQRYYVDYTLYTPRGTGPNVPYCGQFPLEEMDPLNLQKAVNRVLHHFFVFGAVYRFDEESRLVQCYAPEKIRDVSITYTTNEEFGKTLPGLIKPHRLLDSLLYDCSIHVTETHCFLFMDFHHSIMDGAGTVMIVENIMRALRGQELEEDRYPEYLDEVMNRLQTLQYPEEAIRYNLPDYSRKPVMDHASRENGYQCIQVLTDLSFHAVQEALERRNSTLGMSFSAAGLLALRKYNQTDRVQVQWIYHGRNEPWKERLVGITMCALPFAVDFSKPDLDLQKELNRQQADNIAHAELSVALDDNSPVLHDTLNMICEDGIDWERNLTPGAREINMWYYRSSSPAALECVLYPYKTKDQLLMFINFNTFCYEKESVERFGTILFEAMAEYLGLGETSYHYSFAYLDPQGDGTPKFLDE